MKWTKTMNERSGKGETEKFKWPVVFLQWTKRNEVRASDELIDVQRPRRVKAKTCAESNRVIEMIFCRGVLSTFYRSLELIRLHFYLRHTQPYFWSIVLSRFRRSARWPANKRCETFDKRESMTKRSRHVVNEQARARFTHQKSSFVACRSLRCHLNRCAHRTPSSDWDNIQNEYFVDSFISYFILHRFLRFFRVSDFRRFAQVV